jgi:HEAT repeat protein
MNRVLARRGCDFETASPIPMTAEPHDNAELPNSAETLPPVEPPSAKFIVQLFVVPGLIVASIVGVWLLFGKLASAEQDWQALLADMKSSNEHRRGRGAMGLAQALAIDQNRKVAGPRLTTNPQVAQELSAFLTDTLKSSSQEPVVIDQQAFLARTLGLLDVPESVLPALREAMKETHDREVRKNAVAAVATIAFRAHERGTPLTDSGILDELSQVSRDQDPLLRSLAALALGFFPLDLADQSLTVLLADADGNTRANAAISFTRHKSLKAVPVLKEVLKAAAALKQAGPSGDAGPIAATNAMKAIGELAPLLDESTRSEIVKDITTISTDYPEPRVRLDAAQTLMKFRKNP